MRTIIVLVISLGVATSAYAQTFNDVPTDYWAFSFIETLAANGITAGCGGGDYCPEEPVTRAQMAVFLERGMNGGGFSPPAATGNVFTDVAATDFAASFIEQFFHDGITAGCGLNIYCPDDVVTRGQMAVFLLRARYGASYIPPPQQCLPIDPPLCMFIDVNPGFGFGGAWIEQLARDGITAGCGGGRFCPDAPVTRAQMAVFLVRTFDLGPAAEPCCSNVAAVLTLKDVFGQASTSFVQNEEIEFFLSITNNSEVATILSFSDGQNYDFHVTTSNDVEIWRWSDEMVFIAAQTEVLIPAGETLEISATWDQSIPGGGNVDIGSYSAIGSMLHPSTESSVAFTIQ